MSNMELEPAKQSFISQAASELIRTFSEYAADCEDRTAAMFDRVQVLEASLRQIADQAAQAQSAVSALDGRVDRLLNDLVLSRGELGSDEVIEHLRIADQLRFLVEQRVQNAARNYVRGQRSSVSQGERVARMVSRISQALFGSEQVLEDEVMLILGSADPSAGENAASICDAARQLRASAQSMQRALRWDFDFRPSASLDLSRQEPWTSCDEEAGAQFVVVPAYAVERQIFYRQRVYTSGDAKAISAL